MNIVFLLIICSVSLGALFLFIFIWWVKSGQADDLETPAHRMLFDDKKINSNIKNKTANSYE
jgi:cbb3-type cytochrome oxidase maturation protein